MLTESKSIYKSSIFKLHGWNKRGKLGWENVINQNKIHLIFIFKNKSRTKKGPTLKRYILQENIIVRLVKRVSWEEDHVTQQNLAS